MTSDVITRGTAPVGGADGTATPPTPSYPTGSVRALLETDNVGPRTRDVLRGRLLDLEHEPAAAPRFLDPATFRTLRAACARLVPQGDRGRPVDLAAQLDARLAAGEADGWRYDALPPDGDAFRLALDGLDAAAQDRHGAGFADLEVVGQDALLSAVQAGEMTGDVWTTVNPALFFEELLVEATEDFYSDPLAQEEIGYAGMADRPGWTRIGLGEREAREPAALGEATTGVLGLAEHIAMFDAPDRAAPNGAAPADQAPPIGAGAGGMGRRPAVPLSGDAGPEGHGLPRADDPATAVADPAGARPRAETERLPGMRRYPLDEPVDALVIGLGAGGAPVMARLAAAGLSVVALEAGRLWDPAADFATDERAQGGLFWNDERLSAGEDPIAFGRNNSGFGVGGGTLHFTAYAPRALPGDLRLRSEFGVGEDWPFGYEALEPYYDEVERTLGVSGPSPYPWGPPRTPYPLPPLPLNGAAQLMRRGSERLGIRTSPAANAALSAPYHRPGIGWGRTCTNRGFCQAGCTVGAKGSMDVTYVPLALRAGAELRTESHATLFETDERGRVTGVVYTRDGREERQRAKTVFLCAGAIETPRLLLLNGLANSSGQVGRNFMAHPGVQVWGRFEEMVRPYKGIPGGLISEDTHRVPGADFAGGYLLQSIGVMPVTYAAQVARGRGLWGKDLREHMRGYNHVAGINILGECLPHDHNYLELADERDARGLPKPRVHFTAGENERRMGAHAERLMRAIWDEAGARDVWSYPRYAHTIGTCRMGDDPTRSVVDPDGRCHDVPNLYVSDNSTFPSALGCNPTLTIVALALRTADRFLDRARRAA